MHLTHLFSLAIYLAPSFAWPSGRVNLGSMEAAAALNKGIVEDFNIYSEYARSTYCNVGKKKDERIKCGGRCDRIENNGATIVSTFVGNTTEIGSIVALDKARKEIVVAFRGTTTPANSEAWLDAKMVNTSLVKGGQVNEGLNRAWKEIEPSVSKSIKETLAKNPKYRIVSTGHSLGAGVATIAAAYLQARGLVVDMYTYGGPRVGNEALCNFISTKQPGTIYRITHRDDSAPRGPPSTDGHRHVYPEYWLSKTFSNKTDYPLNEIKICMGTDNHDCNGRTSGIHTMPHFYHFGYMLCGPDPGTDNGTIES